MGIVDSFGLVRYSIAVDNSSGQAAILDRALQLNNSSAIRVKRFAHMAIRVLTTSVSTLNLARIMDYLQTSKSLSDLHKPEYLAADSRFWQHAIKSTDAKLVIALGHQTLRCKPCFHTF
jgi:hypothetical protein